MSNTDIASKVMLVSLNIRVFQGKQVDKDTSDEIAARHNTTSAEAGNYIKQTVGKAALKSINAAAAQARTEHYDRTLPYDDNGARLLSVEGYLPYTEAMRGLRNKFDEQVHEFIAVYPRLIEDARVRLNGLFDVNDYPSISQLKHRFSFMAFASPMPSSQNWFLNMADDEVAKLRDTLDQGNEARIASAMKEPYRRIVEVTRKMVERLNAYDPDESKKATFRDSLVTNIADLATLLPSLNVTGDEQLTSITNELRELTQFSATTLRADEKFREMAAQKADEIANLASHFC